jgi:hypothetical protein
MNSFLDAKTSLGMEGNPQSQQAALLDPTHMPLYDSASAVNPTLQLPATLPQLNFNWPKGKQYGLRAVTAPQLKDMAPLSTQLSKLQKWPRKAGGAALATSLHVSSMTHLMMMTTAVRGRAVTAAAALTAVMLTAVAQKAAALRVMTLVIARATASKGRDSSVAICNYRHQLTHWPGTLNCFSRTYHACCNYYEALKCFQLLVSA